MSRDGCWSVPPFERDRDFSFRVAQAAIYIVCSLLVDLGYFLGLAKSVRQPSTRITYLGLVVDTARQAFLLPGDKVVKFAKLREAILASKKLERVKTLQRFQGKCISFSLAVPSAKLFIRSTAAVIASAGSNPQVSMSPALREELTHWRFFDTWEDCIPWRDEKHFILSMSSDCSGFAWGGVFHLPEGNLEVRDYWSSEGAALHISMKEMLALHRVLQSSSAGLRNCRVDVNVVSQVLLDTWSREGSRSQQLTAPTKEVFHFVSERNIQLTLYKVPSKGNVADLPSRHPFLPLILSYLFRVGSESKKHLEGRQVIRLISWPWIPTRSRISRGPL